MLSPWNPLYNTTLNDLEQHLATMIQRSLTIFCDDISYPRHLEKCQKHFWIEVLETFLDVVRHLASGKMFHSEHHNIHTRGIV
jgi:hypothetical protein